MSYLDPSVLGPSALHDGAGCVADRNSRTKRLRKSQSHGLLSPLLRLAKDPVGTLGELRESWTEQGKSEIQDIGEQRQVLYLRMKHAGTYDDWKAAATELDHIEGNDQWKVQDDSLEYNVKLLETRLKELDDARLNCDIKRMLFLIRTSLTRDLGGMGDAQLYRHSHIGTKALIERYIESSRRTIESLLEVSAKQKTVQVDPRQLLEQLLEARQAFGRSALLLSGGGTFGMSHIGVVKCLWEQKLLPRIVSGSSAGSIVCAVLCTKTDAEVPQVLNDFCYGDLSVFINEEEGLLEVAARFLKHGTVFDISNLTRAMRNLIGDITFQEAYNRTRRILNINVSSASLYELPQLLNYVTAPNVIIWSAVAASCSVPLVFSAASLLAKDPKTGEHVQWNPSPQRWIDGSVDSDLPMTRVAEMFNVNHFIVSQVNPHVVPFLDREAIAPYPLNGKNPSTGSTWLHSVANLAKDEAMHRMHVLAEIGVFPTYLTKLRSVLAQRYSGDITILPEISYAQFPRVLQNPTTEFMLDATISGERATWPKLSMIQNHVAIEIALDDAVQQLRARVVFSPSQVDLRINNLSPSMRGRQSKDRPQPRHRPTSSLDPRTRKRRHPPFQTYTPDSDESSNDSSYEPRVRPTNTTWSKAPLDTLAVPSTDVLSSSVDDDPNPFSPATLTSPSSSDGPMSPEPSLVPMQTIPWPSTRKLFPRASQSAIPLTHSSKTAYMENLSQREPNQATSLLIMTPRVARESKVGESTGESEQERRYKTLFHPEPGPKLPKTSPMASRNGEKGVLESDLGVERESENRSKSTIRRGSAHSTRSNSGGFPLDISGTRGMVLRRKQSHMRIPGE